MQWTHKVISRGSSARTLIVAAILFLAAHLALLIGVATPDTFYFDEVHYVRRHGRCSSL